MKNLFYILLAIFTISSAPVYAAGDEASTSATAYVKGMVCDFCAQSLKKVFSKKEAVENIDVDLDAQTVKIFFKANQKLSDADIEEAITWAGYDLIKIEYSTD